MKYYFNKTVTGSFDATIEKVKELLQKEGFGVLTEINIQDTFKKKLNAKHLKLYMYVGLFKKYHWNFLLKKYFK